MKICSRCIYDEKVPAINFDEEGICNYCKQIETISSTFMTGTDEGKKIFLEIVDDIKKKGKGKKYDLIVGVSGGTDSSYLLHLAVELGKRNVVIMKLVA